LRLTLAFAAVFFTADLAFLAFLAFFAINSPCAKAQVSGDGANVNPC
jgi:hypothetical protein